eukprot:10176591-Alexandrium_andersonii.AAC.1
MEHRPGENVQQRATRRREVARAEALEFLQAVGQRDWAAVFERAGRASEAVGSAQGREQGDGALARVAHGKLRE